MEKEKAIQEGKQQTEQDLAFAISEARHQLDSISDTYDRVIEKLDKLEKLVKELKGYEE